MAGCDDAMRVIGEAEADVERRRDSYEWSTTYRQAAEVFEQAGCHEEARQAQWMADLMGLWVVPLPARTGDMADVRWFCPMWTKPMEDGTVVGWPVAEAFTEEALDYYQRKAQQLENPIIACRCHDILWERRGDYHAALCAVSQHLSAADIWTARGEYNDVWNHLSRAIELALTLNNKELIARVKQQWLDTIEAIEGVCQGGSGLIVDLEAQFRRCVNDAERRHFAEQAEAIANSMWDAAGPFAERDWLERATKLYREIGDLDGAKRCALACARSKERQGDLHLSGEGGALVAVNWLHQAWEDMLRLDPSHRDEADAIALKLGYAHERAEGEMKPVGHTITIPAAEWEAWLAEMQRLPLQDRLKMVFLAGNAIPDVEDLRDRVKEYKAAFPLQFLANQVIVDGRNIIARSDTGDEDDYHLMRQMDFEWQIRGQFLARRAWAVYESSPVTAADFLPLLERPFIAPEAIQAILVGIERYLARDFISALHVLIPQFEQCIRYMLRKLGIPTSCPKPQERGVSQEKMLDTMLRDERLEAAMASRIGENVRYFYRFVFTDQRGWNLRNLVCHGLVPAQAFGEPMASTVLLAVLSIGWFEMKAESDQAEPGEAT